MLGTLSELRHTRRADRVSLMTASEAGCVRLFQLFKEGRMSMNEADMKPAVPSKSTAGRHSPRAVETSKLEFVYLG